MKCAHPQKAQEVFSKVLRKVKPTPQENEKSLKAAFSLIEKLKKVAPSFVQIELAGSLAKGTNLKGKSEFDIFILFPRHYSHHEMTLLGLSYARKAFAGMNLESRYAEHPYIQLQTESYKADIVPAYKIDSIEQKGSSVDRSILHTQYVNAHLSLQQKDEVRLLKAFLKALDIYGAELRVEGFSGYLCELLICHYGSLLSLFEAASEWRQPAIDSEGKESQDARKSFNSPLVVIDPVDPKRNVAAVVSQTSLSRFIFACRQFLKNPSEKFFTPARRKCTLARIRAEIIARKTCCLVANFAAPHVVPDVLWPQLKKTTHALIQRLSARGFSVFGHYYWSDGKECAILLEVENGEIPAVQKAIGPSVVFAKDTEAFIQKHSSALNIHIEHDRVVAIERRKVTSAKQALAQECRAGVGVPQHMKKPLMRAKILEGKNAAKPNFCDFLCDYFFARIA